MAGPDRLEAELLLAPPLQADALAGQAPRDQRRVERRIVGAVMAVAAGAVQVPRGDGFGGQAEHRRQVLAQRMHALAMRPHREMAVAELGQRAGRRHRGMRDVGPRDGDLHQPPMGRRSGGASAAPRRCAGLRRAGPSARRPPAARDRYAARCPTWHGSGAAAAAAWATLSTGLTKATKFASRTICSSPFAARRIAASSSAARVAPRLGWRSVRACRRSLGTKSCTKAAPLTFAGEVDARHALADHACRRRRAWPASFR